MRKKFFAMYALVGALVASPVFTSCIDNEESPTVSAVRNAKAEQLKAAAALAQAQTEMEKAVAQAEIAYKNALTEKETAYAQQAKAQVEEAILRSQYNILTLKKQIAEWEDYVFNELVSDYTTALNNVTTINSDIIEKTANIANLKNGLLEVQLYVKSETDRLNNLIAIEEAKIEKLKSLEGLDNTEVNAQKAEIDNKVLLANRALQELKAKYGTIPTTANLTSTLEANIKLATVLAAKKLKAMNNSIPNSFTVDGTSYTKDFVTEDSDKYYVLKEKNVTAYKQYIAAQATNSTYDIKAAEEALALAIAALGTEADKKDTKYVYGTDPTTFEDLKALTKYAELAAAKEDLTAKEKTYKEKKEAMEKAKATKAEKANALAKAQDDLVAEQAKGADADATKLTELQAAVTAAQTAYDTADAAFTTADGAYTPTVQPYENAVDAVEAAEVAVATAKDNVNSKEVALAQVKTNNEEFANFETWVAAFEGEAYEAYKTAKDEIATATTEHTDLTTEQTALDTYLTSGGFQNIAEQIKTCENTIAGHKKDLAYIREGIDLPNEYGNNEHTNRSEADVEALIARIEGQIEVLKAKLTYAQMNLDKAKAALDAYLAEGGDVESGEAEEA